MKRTCKKCGGQLRYNRPSPYQPRFAAEMLADDEKAHDGTDHIYRCLQCGNEQEVYLEPSDIR